MKRSNCYMVWGGEFSGSQQTRITQEDFVIGCLLDLDTGLMTFMASGKEVNTFYQVRYDISFHLPVLWDLTFARVYL